MALIKLPYIGIIDSDALDSLYDATADFNGKKINIDVNFEHAVSAADKIESVKHFIDNIRIHDINNRKKIEFDFFEEDTVAEYIAYHLEELSTADIDELIGKNTKKDQQAELLFKKLRLIRVGIYPDSKEQFAIFDYSFGEEFSDQLIVIDTDINGNFIHLNWES